MEYVSPRAAEGCSYLSLLLFGGIWMVLRSHGRRSRRAPLLKEEKWLSGFLQYVLFAQEGQRTALTAFCAIQLVCNMLNLGYLCVGW